MPAGVTKSVVKTDSGYIMEVSVPLSVIADGLTWHPGVALAESLYTDWPVTVVSCSGTTRSSDGPPAPCCVAEGVWLPACPAARSMRSAIREVFMSRSVSKR